MALLEVSGLTKSFDTARAVDGAFLSAEQGELVCLLGPSGCGKTTLLRLIAGLEEPDEGTVSFDGRSLEGERPEERGFGLMFQDLALFPHMDVFGNVAFGLRMQRLPKAEVEKRVDELLALVDMAGYAQRKVHELSGGERQRVALARALAPAPRLLMLDEPLGALDRVLRDSLQGQVRAILKEVGVTSIYVTHDRDEAFVMADRLMFMDRGRIVRSGTSEEVFADPGSEFVARSLGFKNILSGVVRSAGDILEIDCAVGAVLASATQSAAPAEGSEVTVLIDERGVAVRPAADDGERDTNALSGTVTERVFRGGEHELKVQVGQSALFALAPPDTGASEAQPGTEVAVLIDPQAVKLLKGP